MAWGPEGLGHGILRSCWRRNEVPGLAGLPHARHAPVSAVPGAGSRGDASLDVHGREIYHKLVHESRWLPQEYEAWLQGTLIEALTDGRDTQKR